MSASVLLECMSGHFLVWKNGKVMLKCGLGQTLLQQRDIVIIIGINDMLATV
jgi:hypothetical protein